MNGYHHRVLFRDWLVWCVRDGFKLYGWDHIDSVAEPIALLWRAVP